MSPYRSSCSRGQEILGQGASPDGPPVNPTSEKTKSTTMTPRGGAKPALPQTIQAITSRTAAMNRTRCRSAARQIRSVLKYPNNDESFRPNRPRRINCKGISQSNTTRPFLLGLRAHHEIKAQFVREPETGGQLDRVQQGTTATPEREANSQRGSVSYNFRGDGIFFREGGQPAAAAPARPRLEKPSAADPFEQACDLQQSAGIFVRQGHDPLHQSGFAIPH